jgi:hypothetical protein
LAAEVGNAVLDVIEHESPPTTPASSVPIYAIALPKSNILKSWIVRARPLRGVELATIDETGGGGHA